MRVWQTAEGEMAERRFAASALRQFAAAALEKKGVPAERARAVAEILVEGDLLGQTTHGLQLLTPYLESIDAGGMLLQGEPEVVADRGGTFAWDGRYLPGAWLVLKAMDEAIRRIPDHGVVTATLRRTHHIGALQAYLRRATDRGLVMILTSSDPREESVAPHGGTVARYSPNPLAFGAPTTGEPILIDISMSTTTNGMVGRRHREGRPFDHPWLQDAQGQPTTDAGVRFADPKGAILPLGGPSLGHKGFALGIIVEVLTSALGGLGRAERPTAWGGNVFLQLLDPEAFGGRAAFIRETGFFADFCRETPVPIGAPAVRLPGDGALARHAEQSAHGVRLYPGIEEALAGWAEKLGVPMPTPRA